LPALLLGALALLVLLAFLRPALLFLLAALLLGALALLVLAALLVL